MCLIMEADPAEVSCVWSQAKLPDVEVFPFWRVDSHLMGQLWGQCTKSLWNHKCRAGKSVLPVIHGSVCFKCCVCASGFQKPFSSLCNVLLFLSVFISLTCPHPCIRKWDLPLGLLLDLGLGVQCSHSAQRVQELLLLGHDWVHKVLGGGFWDWQENLHYRHEIQSPSISLNIDYLSI